MARRGLVALTLALGLLLGSPSASAADGGQALANLVASATGLARIYDETLASAAAARTADADFVHADLDAYGLGAWSWGEVIAWNRGYADLSAASAAAVAGWMSSDPHLTILTDPAYLRIGCDHRLVPDPNVGGDDDADDAPYDYFVCIVGTPGGLIGPPIVDELPDTAMEAR